MDLSDATVSNVDDDESLLEGFEGYLHDVGRVLAADGGVAGLDRLDETVDIVLLDRRMPDRSGDEGLETIRERGYSCPVVMITAVAPDEVTASLRFNESVTKPVSEEELRQVVHHALQLSRRDVLVQEYFAQMDILLALESELDLSGRCDDGEYQSILARVEEL